MVALGEPLASGRDADVVAIGTDRVLRRYRDGGDATTEAALMRYLDGCGYPVPRVHDADGADIVMDRIDGPTMLRALSSRGIGVAAAGQILAGLHNQLHELPSPISQDPATRVLHLDLHPDNVLLSSNGPVVIDWRNATEGPPALDVALTTVILAQAAVSDDRRSASIRMLLTAFLDQIDSEPSSMIDEALKMRSKDANLTAREIDLLAAASDFIRSTGSPTATSRP